MQVNIRVERLFSLWGFKDVSIRDIVYRGQLAGVFLVGQQGQSAGVYSSVSFSDTGEASWSESKTVF